MTLSVLLPTRNGAKYLSDCISSVLTAEIDDLELVVSDNASEDATQEVLAAFTDDPRLKVLRQRAPLAVSDNWAAALSAASGSLLLLIGDDDCFLPGTIDTLLASHAALGSPEVLSYEAYGFAFPGALGVNSPAHYSAPLFTAPGMPAEGSLSPNWRRSSVKRFFSFEFTLCPNLQTTLVSREALRRLPRGPFCSPYPDFYAINALLLTARSWHHLCRRLVAVGISPKSFGRTLKEGGTRAGRDYLGIDTTFEGCLPGTDMLNGTHRTLETLKSDFPIALAGIDISRSNYVYRQMYSWYLDFRLRKFDRKELLRRFRLLSPADWAGFSCEFARRADMAMLRRHARVDDSAAIASVWPNMRAAPEFPTIRAFSDWAAKPQHPRTA